MRVAEMYTTWQQCCTGLMGQRMCCATTRVPSHVCVCVCVCVLERERERERERESLCDSVCVTQLKLPMCVLCRPRRCLSWPPTIIVQWGLPQVMLKCSCTTHSQLRKSAHSLVGVIYLILAPRKSFLR
jgi:hypothetical protein